MEPIQVDSIAFCKSGANAPVHPWGIQSGMRFRVVPPPDQPSSTVNPPRSGTVISANRSRIVLQLSDGLQVRISDEQLRSDNYSCPDGSNSRDPQWGCQVVQFSCQNKFKTSDADVLASDAEISKLGMQSVRTPLDYIKDLIEVEINPDLLTDADVLRTNSLQELRKASHQRTSSTGHYISLSHYILDEEGPIQSSSNLVRDFKLYLLDILLVWRFHREKALFPSWCLAAHVAADANKNFVNATQDAVDENLELMKRGHAALQEGAQLVLNHGGQCVSIFASPSYPKVMAVGTDGWMSQVNTQGTAGDTRDASGTFTGVNSMSLVSSTVQPFQDIIRSLVPSELIQSGHPLSMPPPPPAGHPPPQHAEDQNAASSLRHGSQDGHQWLVAYSGTESDASKREHVPYWYDPLSCGEDRLPCQSWVFPQPFDSNESLASSVSVHQVHQVPPLSTGGEGAGMVCETQSQANAGLILKQTASVLHEVFEGAFPRTAGPCVPPLPGGPSVAHLMRQSKGGLQLSGFDVRDTARLLRSGGCFSTLKSDPLAHKVFEILSGSAGMKSFKALLCDRKKWSDIYLLLSPGLSFSGDAVSVFDAGFFGVKPRSCESRGQSRDSRYGASLEAQPGEGAVDMLQRLSEALPSPSPLLAVLPKTSVEISSCILDVLLCPRGNTVVPKSASCMLLEKGAVVDAYPEKTPYNMTLVVVHGNVACLAFEFDSICTDARIPSSAATTSFFSPNECTDALLRRGVQPSVFVVGKGGVLHLRAGTHYSLVSLENSAVCQVPWTDLHDFARFAAVVDVLQQQNIDIRSFRSEFASNALKSSSLTKHCSRPNHTIRLQQSQGCFTDVSLGWKQETECPVTEELKKQVFTLDFNFENLLYGAYVSVGPSLVVSNITLYCHEPSLPLRGEITFPLRGVSFKAVNGTFASMDGQESLLCPNTYTGPVLVFHWGEELQGAGSRKRKGDAVVTAASAPSQESRLERSAEGRGVIQKNGGAVGVVAVDRGRGVVPNKRSKKEGTVVDMNKCSYSSATPLSLCKWDQTDGGKLKFDLVDAEPCPMQGCNRFLHHSCQNESALGQLHEDDHPSGAKRCMICVTEKSV